MDLYTNSDDGNSTFLYSLDGQIGYGAKIGNSGDTSLTYDSGANYYRLQGNDGTLYANDDDYKEIWLSNDAGQYFFGIKNVIANNAGENIIGGNSESNFIVDGSGRTSMWGGAENVADTLQGGDGHNLFWYGLNDGNDLITNAKESDFILMYDVTLDNIADAQVGERNISITLNNGNNLNIQDSGDVTPTFWISAGGSESTMYKYTRSTGTWEQTWQDPDA